MLDFRRAELSDKEWLTEILVKNSSGGCEYTFGNIFVWSPAYDTRIAVCNGFLVTKSNYGEPTYCFPAGNGDLKKCMNELISDSKQCGHKAAFFGLTQKNVDELNEIFPGKFDFFEDRDFFDYVYLTKSLAKLTGKKYHAKRNHISAFEREHNWSYEEINKNNIDECASMNDEWDKQRNPDKSEELNEEHLALKRMFENYFDLDFTGGLIRADGKVVAFTVGERLNENTFCTHFEKAYADIRGAYPIINREFAKNSLQKYKFVNREDDVGEEGLRKAKLSYHPEYLLVKYTAVMKE